MSLEDADTDAARILCGQLFLSLFQTEADPAGFILVPGTGAVKFFDGPNNFDKIEPRLRRAVNARFKVIANLDPELTDKPQVGYYCPSVEGSERQDTPCAIIQTRPTPVGEELLVRLAKQDDPSIPYAAIRS